MTRIITYSLRAGGANSNEYHRAISSFANTWLDQTRLQYCDLVDGFRSFRLGGGEAERSDSEYLFELLALGVLLREHGEEASHAPGWTQSLLRRLVELQARHPRAEQTIKLMRGWLGWIVNQIDGRKAAGDSLGHLLDWLNANDETTKADRLAQWREYFNAQGDRFTQDSLSRCLRLADNFAATSLAALGIYTENVEYFLAKEAPKYRRRYDARLLSRTRTEYHLGMLGTEILSRAFRERFLSAQQKMVILPPCMSAPADKCKAVDTPLGAKCQACTPTCRVHQITKLGEKLGFGVTMIPDDVKVFGAETGGESVGLVGVSCALTNWGGGWDAGEAGIPAQGLLLDYVGCTHHWDKHGIPTDVNLKRLREILGR